MEQQRVGRDPDIMRSQSDPDFSSHPRLHTHMERRPLLFTHHKMLVDDTTCTRYITSAILLALACCLSFVLLSSEFRSASHQVAWSATRSDLSSWFVVLSVPVNTVESFDASNTAVTLPSTIFGLRRFVTCKDIASDSGDVKVVGSGGKDVEKGDEGGGRAKFVRGDGGSKVEVVHDGDSIEEKIHIVGDGQGRLMANTVDTVCYDIPYSTYELGTFTKLNSWGKFILGLLITATILSVVGLLLSIFSAFTTAYDRDDAIWERPGKRTPWIWSLVCSALYLLAALTWAFVCQRHLANTFAHTSLGWGFGLCLACVALSLATALVHLLMRPFPRAESFYKQRGQRDLDYESL